MQSIGTCTLQILTKINHESKLVCDGPFETVKKCIAVEFRKQNQNKYILLIHCLLTIQAIILCMYLILIFYVTIENIDFSFLKQTKVHVTFSKISKLLL